MEAMESLAGYKVGNFLYLYLSPLMLFGGLIGNFISFLVMWQRALEPPPINLYLSILAIFDSGSLLIPCLNGWLKHLSGFDVKLSMGCGNYFYFWFMMSDVAGHLIVCIAFDRFIHIFFPYKAPRLCTLKKAGIVITCVILFMVTINSHLLWGKYTKYEAPSNVTMEQTEYKTTSESTVAKTGYEPPTSAKMHATDYKQDYNDKVIGVCDLTEGFENWYKYTWPPIDLAVYAIIPSTALLILNPLILIRAARKPPGEEVSSEAGREASNKKRAAQKKMNMVLILICIFYIFGTVPITIVLLVEHYWDLADPHQAATHYLITALAEHSMYLNNSINFFIYLATAKKFRTDLRRMSWRFVRILSCNKVHPIAGEVINTTHSTQPTAA